MVPSDAISNLLTLAHEKNSCFLLSFMGVYPDFAESLVDINPAMKSTDIEFCAYIKLNLDTKQIVVIKNMSVRAVERKKYRI